MVKDGSSSGRRAEGSFVSITDTVAAAQSAARVLTAARKVDMHVCSVVKARVTSVFRALRKSFASASQASAADYGGGGGEINQPPVINVVLVGREVVLPPDASDDLELDLFAGGVSGGWCVGLRSCASAALLHCTP